ncbi:beta-lactamase regulator AmpE [Pseudoalteromonas sp. T1lg65]|uniref:beta-lactamase regulator AmpE n=1 Tax=Pseudoalteromonas sp. T1lg65 TaxID=2077101 RepID=UPI003F799818
MILISIILALIIERLGAKERYWQSEYYLCQYYQKTKKHIAHDGLLGSTFGTMLWVLVPTCIIAVIFNLSEVIVWQFIVNVVILLVCFGCANYRDLYKKYLNALTRGDNEAATLYALQMGQDKLEHEPGGETFGQTLAWINFQHYCAVMFWFVALGAPGAVFYASVRQLVHCRDNLVDTPLERLMPQFSRLYFGLNWLPARIASFGFLIIGNFSKGTSTWIGYLLDFKTSNRKVVTNIALAAEQIEQQFLGCTFEATCMMRLVKRNILFYLVIIAVLSLLGVVD